MSGGGGAVSLTCVVSDVNRLAAFERQQHDSEQ